MEILKDILESIGYAMVCIVIGYLVTVVLDLGKKNFKFGKYPSCDMLNNAIRYLQNGDIDNAMIEIIFAIDKADGYFHEDNVPIVEAARKAFWEKHNE